MKKPPKRPSQTDQPGTRQVQSAPSNAQCQGAPAVSPEGEAKARSRPKGSGRSNRRAPGRFPPAGRQSLTEQRSETDTDGEDRQQQGHRALATAQHILGVGGKLRQEQCPVQPEPGNPENRQENGAILSREADVAPGFGKWIEADHQLRDRQQYVTGRKRLHTTRHVLLSALWE